MGQRVAELKTPGCSDVDGYCVYQSTGMACFVPIFYNQLAAELFASTLQNIYPRWSDASQEELATSVNDYILGQFGERPEEHVKYMDTLSDVGEFAQFRCAFLRYWSN
jgi:hypothetical protein